MPEHVHLLVSEPEEARLSTAIQALKQSVSRSLALRHPESFWQARYYDFNVWSDRKRIEKLRYMHLNPGCPAHELCALGWKPVVRGLVARPEDWQWSSFRHYQTGVERAVEIESEGTAHRREKMGIRPRCGPAQCIASRPSKLGRATPTWRFKMGRPPASKVVACLVLGVVGDVQRLNLAEELVAFGVIGGELVETFAEGIQLEADTLTANPVVVKVTAHRNISGGKCPHLGSGSSLTHLR